VRSVSRKKKIGLPHPFSPLTLGAVLILLACAHHEEAAETPILIAARDPILLPRDVYLSAIDASLARLRQGVQQLWIVDSQAVALTRSELRSRRVRRGNGFRKCPGEPTLWVDAPVQRAGGDVDLHVVEAAPGRAAGHAYTFLCADGNCRLNDEYGTNESILVTCGPGVEFGSWPHQHPLTQSPSLPE
jgi:hypothetical protein